MDINVFIQVLIELIAITFPNSTSQVSYDYAGFVSKNTSGKISWEFVIGNGNGFEAIFVEEFKPLWFTIMTRPMDSSINRIVYQRNDTKKSYIAVSLNATNEPKFDIIDYKIEGSTQCFADLSTLYCLEPKIRDTRLLQIGFCDISDNCYTLNQHLLPITSSHDFPLVDYDACTSTMYFANSSKGPYQTLNLFNLTIVDMVDVKEESYNMCYNYTDSQATRYYHANFLSNFSSDPDSKLFQYRFTLASDESNHKSCPIFSTSTTTTSSFPVSSTASACKSYRTLFTIFFYAVLFVYAVYLLINAGFLGYLCYRRYKSFKKLSKKKTALKEFEEYQKKASEEKDDRGVQAAGKPIMEESMATQMITARQPREFNNESVITADIPSSHKPVTESIADNE